MNELEQACDLILTVYQDKEDHPDKWEVAYLEEASEEGVAKLGEACHAVFGVQLSQFLFDSIQYAQEANQHAHDYMTDSLTDGEAAATIRVAFGLAIASKVLCQIQQRQNCDLIELSIPLTNSTADYARAIKRKLDPRGRICPEVIGLLD